MGRALATRASAQQMGLAIQHDAEPPGTQVLRAQLVDRGQQVAPIASYPSRRRSSLAGWGFGPGHGDPGWIQISGYCLKGWNPRPGIVLVAHPFRAWETATTSRSHDRG